MRAATRAGRQAQLGLNRLQSLRSQTRRRRFFKPLMLLYKGRTAARPNSRAPPSTYPRVRPLGYLQMGGRCSLAALSVCCIGEILVALPVYTPRPAIADGSILGNSLLAEIPRDVTCDTTLDLTIADTSSFWPKLSASKNSWPLSSS